MSNQNPKYNMNIKDHAFKGGKSRWLPKVTHQGILRIMDKELPCVVLEDGRRLITQASVFKAFDRPPRGSKSQFKGMIQTPPFLDAKNLLPYINTDIAQLIQPINYIGLNKEILIGYLAEIIPSICDLYLCARRDKRLTSGQIKIAQISELLISSLSKVGIRALIDEATGYQQIRPRDALQIYLNKILGNELAAWSKRFPDIFYSNIYKLKGWPEFSTSKNKYSCVGYYTNDIIYSRLGQDVLNELKNRTSETNNIKMHQWLSGDIGNPLLTEHIKSVMTLQKLALAQGYGWKRFLDMVDLIHPKKINALSVDESMI